MGFGIHGDCDGFVRIGRSIEVTAGQNISVAIDVPAAIGTIADFALLGHFGAPSTMTPLPLSGGGALCFTPIFGIASPSFFTIAASVPLPGTVFPTAPAPLSLVYPAGIPIPGIEILIQLAIAPLGSVSWMSGNAIRIVSVL